MLNYRLRQNADAGTARYISYFSLHDRNQVKGFIWFASYSLLSREAKAGTESRPQRNTAYPLACFPQHPHPPFSQFSPLPHGWSQQRWPDPSHNQSTTDRKCPTEMRIDQCEGRESRLRFLLSRCI